jgi:hypothetical protein
MECQGQTERAVALWEEEEVPPLFLADVDHADLVFVTVVIRPSCRILGLHPSNQQTNMR